MVAKDSVNAMYMEASLWHRRLGHISEKGLNCLAKNDVLMRLRNAELEKCSHCMAGKQTRVSFKKHLLRSIHPQGSQNCLNWCILTFVAH